MNNLHILKAAITGLGGVLAYLFGEWEGVILALTFAVCLDYMTGIIAAGVQGELNSKIGFKGLLKKVGIFLIVALCGLLDRVMPGTNGALRQAASVFYIANEALSIIENAGRMGVPIPKMIKRAVLTLKDESDTDKDARNETPVEESDDDME